MANINQQPRDKNGKLHGEWIGYYNSGSINYRINYFHGVVHGLQEGYNYDGRLEFSGYWKMGKEIGYWFLYNEKRYYLCLI